MPLPHPDRNDPRGGVRATAASPSRAGRVAPHQSTRLTRRQFLAGIGAGAAVIVIAACAGPTESPASAVPSPRITPPASPPPSTTRPAGTPPGSGPPTATATPAGSPAYSSSPSPSPSGADLRARIGQMLLVGFRGLVATGSLAVVRDIRTHGLGGVVLFDFDTPTGRPVRNVQSPAQLKALVAGLQAAAVATNLKLPLIVSIDEEGGQVARLGPGHGFPATLSAAALGARDDPAYTTARGKAIATTLAAMGINLNLAPVVDLDVNPTNPIIGALDRSFSADPAIVTGQALAFIAGHHARGVRTTLKHFPGHGSSTGDTHLGVVDVSKTWTRTELQPFGNIISAGVADAVLTAHVFNATLDSKRPATLSHATITSILRGQLGWDGVVISDDMQMGAIRQAFGYEEAVALAIGAGVDILTIANQQVFEADIVPRTIEIIAGHVASGRLTEARIDQSYRRITALKARLLPPAT